TGIGHLNHRKTGTQSGAHTHTHVAHTDTHTHKHKQTHTHRHTHTHRRTMDIRKRSEEDICCRYSGFLCRSLSMYTRASIIAQGEMQASLRVTTKYHSSVFKTRAATN